MVSMTLSINKELKNEMDKFPEINWSEVARQAINTKVSFLKKANKLLSKSELTEEDAVNLGNELKRRIAKKMGV